MKQFELKSKDCKVPWQEVWQGWKCVWGQRHLALHRKRLQHSHWLCKKVEATVTKGFCLPSLTPSSQNAMNYWGSPHGPKPAGVMAEHSEHGCLLVLTAWESDSLGPQVAPTAGHSWETNSLRSGLVEAVSPHHKPHAGASKWVGYVNLCFFPRIHLPSAEIAAARPLRLLVISWNTEGLHKDLDVSWGDRSDLGEQPPLQLMRFVTPAFQGLSQLVPPRLKGHALELIRSARTLWVFIWLRWLKAKCYWHLGCSSPLWGLIGKSFNGPGMDFMLVVFSFDIYFTSLVN